MKLLFIAFLLVGCQIHTGIGVRKTIYDNDSLEKTMPNPAFRLVANHKITDKQTIFYEHLSSIQGDEEDYGINVFGWMIQIK